MATVNVNRSVTDQFYRYKMPKLIAKVEGKGNGIKTVIVNMVDIAKSLVRPATYPTKFFGCELGAQTQMDEKNDRYIVNGSHDQNHLQDMLDVFIKKFVLCPECDNPETILSVNQKKQIIGQRCSACGYQGTLDMRHKLTTYMLKNPPPKDPYYKDSKEPSVDDNTPSKKGSKSKKRSKNEKNAEQNGELEKGDGSVSPQPMTPINDVPPEQDDYDDDDWGDDTSAVAVAKRMEELTDGAKTMMLNDDLEKTPQERVDLFYHFVKTLKDNGQLDGADKEILQEAERLDVRDKASLVLCELLFDENMIQQIKQHRNVLLRFTVANAKCQKYLMGGVEQVIKCHKDALLPKVAHILKSLYDMDILDEEVILDWAKKTSKKYVSKELSIEIHEKASPFIKWLNEADEESESEEDEEEDLEVVYDNKGRDKPAVVVAAPIKKIENEDGEDIDIDDI